MTASADCAALEALADWLSVRRHTPDSVRSITLCRRAADKLRRIEEILGAATGRELPITAQIRDILQGEQREPLR